MTAILYALISIFLWGSLALLSTFLQDLPPLLLTGLALLISGLVSLISIRNWRINARLLLLGVAGILGYHYLYFLALRNAPTIEANLINYLWPLLIVVLTPLFFANRSLKGNHILGALLGLAGVGLITSGGKISFDLQYLPGYLFALGAALTWACYSLFIKRFPPFPTSNVGCFCLTSGLLAILIFAVQNGGLQPVRSIQGKEWIFLLLMGLGPLGAAFFTWDKAMKLGDSRIVGSLAYVTPLISTLNLIVFGQKQLNWVSLTAMLLIIGGAVLGSLELLGRKEQPQALETPVE